MASNDNKKKARRLQQENPGLKYTEALRHIEAGGRDDSVLFGRSLENGEPTFVDLSTPRLEWDPKTGETIALDEAHHLRPSEKSAGVVEHMARLARRGGHDKRPSLAVQRLSDLIDNFDTGGRAPWPVRAGDYTDDWTPAVLYPLENRGSLAVCGNAMAGHTTYLRSLAGSALVEGWVVTVVGGKGDEYRRLREQSPWRVNTVPIPEVGEIQALLAGVEPGTASAPRLLVIDNGSYLFEGADEDAKWMETLARLAAHPHTAVVLQIARLSAIPARLREHFRSRALLGRASHSQQKAVFGDVAPAEVLDSFDFDQPAWSGTSADRGRGVLWDGRELRHMTVNAPRMS